MKLSRILTICIDGEQYDICVQQSAMSLGSDELNSSHALLIFHVGALVHQSLPFVSRGNHKRKAGQLTA